jgi:hypothetical protein
MIDPRTASLLQRMIRREGRSLLQYLGDAFPWIKSGEQESLRQLHVLVKEERDAVAELAKFLSRQRVAPPYLGAYPMGFTTLNFVTLESLLPRLVAFQQRCVANLESDLHQIQDPDAIIAVHRLLEVKKRHLKALEALAAPAKETIPA